MIYDRYIGASATIGVRDLDDHLETLARKMADSIVGEAERHGVPVNVEDVVVYRTGENDMQMTVDFGAVWAPSPMTRGIEFFGGSHDGEIMMQIEPDDGPGRAFPPRSIRVMSEPPTSFDGDPVGIESRVLVEDYERAGIDPLKRRFIYKIKVTN
ncbi:hypothetical protein SEA_PICKLES13_60 [Microbacterium phage Pickles13]|nr:hypothetical protein SEA_PICKLES13_60 [Microbacterium phage Pickles13]